MNYETKIILLQSKAYQDTSLLINGFSEDYGRVTFIAKGARKHSKNNFKGLLQITTELNVILRGRGDVKTLNQCDLIRPCFSLSQEGLICAHYISELILRTLALSDPHPTLYPYLNKAMETVNDSSLRLMTLRLFEIQLLNLLGTNISYHYDMDGDVIDKNKNYYLISREGFKSICALNDQLIHKKSLSFPGDLIINIQKEKFSELQVITALKHINRYLLQAHLGNKPLKSREFWLEYNR